MGLIQIRTSPKTSTARRSPALPRRNVAERLHPARGDARRPHAHAAGTGHAHPRAQGRRSHDGRHPRGLRCRPPGVTWVADALVTVAYLLGEASESERSAMLGDVHAPALLDIEVTQTLRGLLRAAKIDRGTAEMGRDELTQLDIRRYLDAHLLRCCWDRRDVCTIYDALYVSLTETASSTDAYAGTIERRARTLRPAPTARAQTSRTASAPARAAERGRAARAAVPRQASPRRARARGTPRRRRSPGRTSAGRHRRGG